MSELVGKATKRTKARSRRGNLRAILQEAMLEITSDKTQDWQIGDIAEEADARGLIPAWAVKEMMKTWLTKAMREAGRRAQKNVGTKENPIWVRTFGVYHVTVQTETGEKDVPCWRVWEQMSRNEMIDAIHALFKIRDAVDQEAKCALKYANKLLVDRGARPLVMDDVR